jgi:cell fate (sporulation/competence/biofilm development) regulator YmcA (YheA/YmcA/DUF963 family)
MSICQAEHPVLSMARRFAERLQASAEIQRFRQAEHQVKDSQSVHDYIETIKRKQKELVHAKHYQKEKYVRQLEKELKHLQEKLEQLPIVREYQQSQAEINDLLQIIQQVLAHVVSTKIHVEVGGEVSYGCGAGGACGCKKPHGKTP